MERIDKYLLITVCLSVFLLSACRSTKRGAETANNAVITDICSTQALLPGDSCMSGKLRLTVDVDGKSLSTTGTVKMVRGNGIQLGFTALGLFEVARFEFFPNEALLINKFNREYSSLGYNDIPFLGYAGLDYSMFEALLLNEPFVSGGGSFQESLAYMNIVKFAAMSTRNMYLKFAETDDIINEATIALMSAIDSYDPNKGVKFETYASIKVRGAIIDFIRRQDFVPRNIRRFAKEYDSAYSILYSELDREPTAQEIADYMKLPVEKLESCTAQAAAAQTLSFEEMVMDGGFDIPDKADEDGMWAAEAGVHRQEKMKYLADAIRSLKERERLVITLYYYEKLRFSDIGKVLDVSESRVCQIHSQAVVKMKKYMTENFDI